MSTTGTISAGRTRWPARKTPSGRYDYGKSFGKRSVYTPQAVINGRVHVNGAKREAVDGALAELENTGKGLSVDINVTRTGESVDDRAGGAPGGKGNAHLVLVYFDPMKPVTIERGENKRPARSPTANAVTERADRRHVARQGRRASNCRAARSTRRAAARCCCSR